MRTLGPGVGSLGGGAQVVPPRPGVSLHLRLTVMVLSLHKHAVSVLVGLRVPTVQYMSLSPPSASVCRLPGSESLSGFQRTYTTGLQEPV